MGAISYKGCGVDSAKTFGYDPLTERWIEEDFRVRCGEFRVVVPFEYDQRLCRECAVRLGLIW